MKVWSSSRSLNPLTPLLAPAPPLGPSHLGFFQLQFGRYGHGIPAWLGLGSGRNAPSASATPDKKHAVCDVGKGVSPLPPPQPVPVWRRFFTKVWGERCCRPLLGGRHTGSGTFGYIRPWALGRQQEEEQYHSV
jgi:hypothetical protein